jgi:hypothetical protein
VQFRKGSREIGERRRGDTVGAGRGRERHGRIYCLYARHLPEHATTILSTVHALRG